MKFIAAEAGFKVGDKSFNAGSYIIKSDGNPGDTAARLGREATDLGLTVTAVDKAPEVASHAVQCSADRVCPYVAEHAERRLVSRRI